ncbi:MAG: 30S ribosome-binding factor RbfA [Flavobacteriales bacterium]
MASIRQNKISELIKRELSLIFRQNASTICKGAMVTVTIVRVTKDLSQAKIYLSIFGSKDNQEAYNEIVKHKGQIRNELARTVRNQLRKTPELHFFIDDSLDYAMKIDELLK